MSEFTEKNRCERAQTLYFRDENFPAGQNWTSSISRESGNLPGMISQIGEKIFVKILKWSQLENKKNAFTEGERVVVFREIRNQFREILSFADISNVPPMGEESSTILHRETFFQNYFEQKNSQKVRAILQNLAKFMEIDFDLIQFSDTNSLVRSFDELLATQNGVCQFTQFCPTSHENIHLGAREALAKMGELHKKWAVMILGQNSLPASFLNKVNEKQAGIDIPFFHEIARADIENIVTGKKELTILGVLRSSGFLAGCKNFSSEEIFAEIKFEIQKIRAKIGTTV